MLDLCALALNINILPNFAAECCSHHLYAAADAQHRYLSVEGFASEEEFRLVPFGADTMELGQRLFAQEQRIDVVAAGEDDAVQGLEQCDKRFLVVALTTER